MEKQLLGDVCSLEGFSSAASVLTAVHVSSGPASEGETNKLLSVGICAMKASVRHVGPEFYLSAHSTHCN